MSSNNQPNNQSNWEKIVAVCLATIVLATFIFYIFNPAPISDGTLPLIRFLAATFSGLAAFLFVGDLNLEGSIPGLNDKIKVRAAGGFAAFLIVFFLFFYKIQPEGDSNLPSSEAVTLWGSYPTLALFDPKEPQVPDILAKERDVISTPIIFQKSPVFDSIQKFITETGNQNFIANFQDTSASNVQYSINNGSRTQESFANKEVNQTQEQFEQDSLIDEGVYGTARAEYSPILMNFSTNPEEAIWTAITISENTFDSPLITQYPKLSNIGTSNLTFKSFLGFNRDTNKTWIQNVINANPDHRGLIGYDFKYISDLYQKNLTPDACGTTNLVVNTDLFLPYVKFIDVWNTNQEPVQLESITYKLAFQEEDPYKLRDSSTRSQFFVGASKKTDKLNITLPAGRHFFIPIEFGFQFNEQQQRSTATLSPSSIYLPKPLNEDERIPGIPSSPEEIRKYNLSIAQEIRLDDDFLSNVKYSKNDVEIPHKLAIGSVLEIESLVVNQRKTFTPKPQDKFSASIAQRLGLGSCPYLLVFDSTKGYWIDLGTVLYNRASKRLQDVEIHGLNNGISKIQLQERENEITFLDYLAILYTDPLTGANQEAIPAISDLSESDNQYLVLHKGENLEIDLDGLVPDNALDLKLKINGYYERI